MFKKAIPVVFAAVALMVYAVPALAYSGIHFPDNEVSIHTETTAYANTGGNSQTNLVSVEKASHVVALSVGINGYKSISTGNASAYARTFTVANTGYGLGDDEARLHSTTEAGAETGLNYQDNQTVVTQAHKVIAGSASVGGAAVIRTGSARSVARDTNLINVHTYGLTR